MARSEQREPVTRERAVRVAMALADAGGIGSLSMRKLAGELGIEATSLYYHVKSKDDILDGMLDLVYEEIAVPRAGIDWRTPMRERADSTRKALAIVRGGRAPAIERGKRAAAEREVGAGVEGAALPTLVAAIFCGTRVAQPVLADAWRPEVAAQILAGLTAPWCVAGGWALDLWLGHQSRKHEDLEIAVPATRFAEIQERLEGGGFRLFAVGDGQVRAMAPGAVPPEDINQTWILDEAAGAWRLDVFREPGDAETWVYRRDPSLTAPRPFMVGRTAEGLAYLGPHGALLFKARKPREKDEADFTLATPRLAPTERAWLIAALEAKHPGHPWIAARNAGYCHAASPESGKDLSCPGRTLT